MATYKVIQDIEAEDHILGPLSLRQFIFAIIAVLCFYFSYLLISRHLGFLAIIFIPPGLFTAFFAFPFGKDQPTEVWALAKIRFLFKPRRRIWDQSGVKDLVTITVPKKLEEIRTDGLSQTEVKSRLTALASTIDSRGWAIKNVNVNLYSQPGLLPMGTGSDRLIDVSSIPQEVPSYDVQAADDIMDPLSNPIAQQFDQMITASSQAHRQQLITMLNQPPASAQPPQATATSPADYWFLNQPVNQPALSPNQAVFTKSQVVTPGTDDTQQAVIPAAEPTAAEEAFAEQVKAQRAQPEAAYAHMKTIQPLDAQRPAVPAAAPSQSIPSPVDPDLMQLAANNDLNVATIARQANKSEHPDDDNEVVIALH